MELNGKVLWYSDRDGNGIIKTKGGVEFYFDSSVCRELLKQSGIFRGQPVKFIHNDNITDCNCAKNIRLMDIEEFKAL